MRYKTNQLNKIVNKYYQNLLIIVCNFAIISSNKGLVKTLNVFAGFFVGGSMKKVVLVMLCFIVLNPINVNAQRGCCSHHGGVSGCTSSGRTICSDGTLSPSCTCTPPVIYGCTDPKANNYNQSANKNNGTCKYDVYGCTDSSAINYNSNANLNDNTCNYEKIIEETEEIPFETKESEDTSLKYGESKVIIEGVNGSKLKKYKIVVDSNNNELSREMIEEAIVTEPVTKEISKNSTVKSFASNSVKDSNNSISPKEDEISFFPIISIFMGITMIVLRNKKIISGTKILNNIYQTTNNGLKIFYFMLYIFFIILPLIDLVYVIVYQNPNNVKN